MNQSRVSRMAHLPIKIKIYILGEQLAKKINAFKYCETSAKTGEGVKEAFEAAIISKLKEKLFWAVKLNDKEICEQLLLNGENVNESIEDNTSPLSEAARLDHHDIVKLLLKHHADINACNENGDSPFSLAAFSGHHDIVHLLLENGSKITSNEDKYGVKFISKLKADGYPEIVKLCIEKYGSSLLSITGKDGEYAAFKFLIELGVKCKPKIIKQNGPLLLSRASADGQFDAVKFLVDLKVDLNQRDRGGDTPLSLAAGGGHLKVGLGVKALAANPVL